LGKEHALVRTQLHWCAVALVKVLQAATPHLVKQAAVAMKQLDMQMKAMVHGYIIFAKAALVDAALLMQQQGHQLWIDNMEGAGCADTANAVTGAKLGKARNDTSALIMHNPLHQPANNKNAPFLLVIYCSMMPIWNWIYQPSWPGSWPVMPGWILSQYASSRMPTPNLPRDLPMSCFVMPPCKPLF